MISRIGFVDQEKIWKFVKGLENSLELEKWNGKVNLSGRECVWLGVGVELGFQNKTFKGMEIENGLRKRCNQLWGGEDWNSILVYKYQKGIELKQHVDRDIFHNKVILINISQDNLFGGNVKFLYDGKVNILSNGEIIEFDNKILHGVEKVESERWSISIRKVK